MSEGKDNEVRDPETCALIPEDEKRKIIEETAQEYATNAEKKGENKDQAYQDAKRILQNIAITCINATEINAFLHGKIRIPILDTLYRKLYDKYMLRNPINESFTRENNYIPYVKEQNGGKKTKKRKLLKSKSRKNYRRKTRTRV